MKRTFERRRSSIMEVLILNTQWRLAESGVKILAFGALLLTTLVALVACSGNGNSVDEPDSETLELQGDVSAIYSGGSFVLWVPEVEPLGGVASIALADPAIETPDEAASISGVSSMSATRGSGSTLAAPTSSSSSSSRGSSSSVSMTAGLMSLPDTIPEGAIVFAEAVIKDGTFSLTLEVEEIKPINFSVRAAERVRQPFRMPMRTRQFILEPGQLTLSMDEFEQYLVEGGPYNDAVFNSWKQSDEYLSAQKLYREKLSEPNPDSADERLERLAATRGQFTELVHLESEGRKEVALNHPDVLVRRLALQTTTVTTGIWYAKALSELKESAPDDPWIAKIIEKDQERQAQIDERDSIAVGTSILDFQAIDLVGDSASLSDVQKGSQVVLLDFWASWCGPCRQEFPHLKEAYSKFKDKGFEIVSFTLDDEQEDWELATEEEEIPWINLGMGSEAEAVKTYSVVGIPYSLLYEVDTGTIVAKNLSGGELEAKLEELLH
ncbi:MAG: AhpC/TSA family protein [Gammaproteobacteria bacterium]|nr:AhpC/TSA family protein [Gammaproteobacteria bacterium]MYF38156.1 AhpC/TSA family protein [Gammaproteobacteria bacterium]